MLQDWEDGLIGNSEGAVSRLPRRETLAQVLVRSFQQLPPAASGRFRRTAVSLPRAA